MVGTFRAEVDGRAAERLHSNESCFTSREVFGTVLSISLASQLWMPASIQPRACSFVDLSLDTHTISVRNKYTNKYSTCVCANHNRLAYIGSCRGRNLRKSTREAEPQDTPFTFLNPHIPLSHSPRHPSTLHPAGPDSDRPTGISQGSRDHLTVLRTFESSPPRSASAPPSLLRSHPSSTPK